MRTFHYFAPAPEEQRGFALQFLGVVLGAALASFLAWRSPDANLRALLIGAVLALAYNLARTAWSLRLPAMDQNAM